MLQEQMVEQVVEPGQFQRRLDSGRVDTRMLFRIRDRLEIM